MPDTNEQRSIYSVSELTREIKDLIEDKFPFVWLTGEISNFSKPASGHCYFTLKDKTSQISGVLFRGQGRNIKFAPENGMSITGFGRIALYEPRGSYQIIFEYIEPMGSGALQVAFEQLKERLASEGLFDAKHKTTLPYLPRQIAIITSSTGAVIHDFINVASRRFQNININIVPVTVQGDGAVKKIVNAIQFLNDRHLEIEAENLKHKNDCHLEPVRTEDLKHKIKVSKHKTFNYKLSMSSFNPDIIVLARGGGSLEDMQPFNSEEVARAIYASKIPIISAIGHETDYTIADFTADFRAPTPSVAAEIIFPEKLQLQKRLNELDYTLKSTFERFINNRRYRVEAISKRLIHPKKRLEELKLKMDDLLFRIIRATDRTMRERKEKLRWKISSLYTSGPKKLIKQHVENNNNLKLMLISGMYANIKNKKMKLNEFTGRLNALNPKAILNRGYSITRTIPEADVITDASEIQNGRLVEVLLSKGKLQCRVEEK